MGGNSKKGRKDRKDRQNLADIITLNYSCVQQAPPTGRRDVLNQYLVERSSTGDYVSGKATYRTAPPKRKAVDPKVLKEGFMAHHYQFVLRPSEDFTLGSTTIRALNPEPSSVSGVQPSRNLMPPLDQLAPQRIQQMTVGLETATGALDGVLNWDYVLFVTVPLPIDEFICPICLEQPIAPRMTSCGHIFCFSCILRSMNAQKNLGTTYTGSQPADAKVKKRTCPMCSSVTGAMELRPCIHQIVTDQPPQQGEEESFTLVCRHKDSAAVVLGDAYARSSTALAQWLIPPFGCDDAVFSRYCFATEGLLEGHFEQEVRDLQRRLCDFEELPRPFTDDQAFEHHALFEALQLLLQSGYNYAQYSDYKQSMLRKSSPLSTGKMATFEDPSSDSFSRRESSLVMHPTVTGESNLAAVAGRPTAPAPVLWFYQSSDGSRRYLHSLNRRMLRREYKYRGGADGSGNAHDGDILPALVRAPILAILSPTQDMDTKATDLHTAHVPLGSTLTTVYVDLSNVVSEEVMIAFRDECSALEHRLAVKGARERAAEEEASHYASQATEAAQARSSQYGYRGTFSQHYVGGGEAAEGVDEGDLTAEELAWLTAEGVPTPSPGSTPSLKSKRGPIDVDQLPDLSSLTRGDGLSNDHTDQSSSSAQRYPDANSHVGGSSVGTSTVDGGIKAHGCQRQAKRLEAIVAADRLRVSSEARCPASTTDDASPPKTQDENPFSVLQGGTRGDMSQWAQRAATSDYNRLHGAAVPHAKPSWAGRPMKTDKDH